MLHRVNSEGLRRRAIAPRRRRAKRAYIVFGYGPLSTACDVKIQPCESPAKRGRFAAARRHAAPGLAACASPAAESGRLRRTAATFLRRSLHNRVGECAMPGERHYPVSFDLRRPVAVIGPVGPHGAFVLNALAKPTMRSVRSVGRDWRRKADGAIASARGQGTWSWTKARLRGANRRFDAEAIDLGNEPPLSVDGGTGGLVDRRRLSVQWFCGTILTGLCGAALMGGAVFASLDGETNFAAGAGARRDWRCAERSPASAAA